MIRTALMGLLASVCLMVACPSVALAQLDAGDFDLFLRVDGQDGIDSEGNEVGISLVPGSTFLGQIILRETVGGATPILGGSSGLASAAISIDILGNTTIENERSAFFASFLNGDQSGPGLVRGIALGSGPSPVSTVAPGVFESVAGQFDINLDPSGLPSVITFSDFGTGGEFAIATAGDPTIDDFINFRSTTIAAIPEPSSLAVLGLGTVGMVFRRRRR